MTLLKLALAARMIASFVLFVRAREIERIPALGRLFMLDIAMVCICTASGS